MTPRTAVVTGGAQGIGAGVARRLADNGVQVAIWDAQDEAARSVAERIGTSTTPSIGLGCDVSDPGSIASALKRTRAELGTPSMLVTAAGIMRVTPFLQVPPEQWARVLDVNLSGTFFCVQSCAQAMVEDGIEGSIACVASVAARGPRPDAPDYGASKAGVVSVVRSAAVALAPHRITVNAVCPGVVDTDMTRRNAERRSETEGIAERQALQRLTDQIPLGRVQSVDDVADVVLFLLSPAAGYVTGQALNACGGMEFD